MTRSQRSREDSARDDTGPPWLDEKGGHEMDAKRKMPARDDGPARARRSRRIHAFLSAWAQRHWPERVTRFPKR